MEWVLATPQMHSTFGALGYLEGETYHTNDDCLATLKEILTKLTGEDRTLRTFRRAVGFGQNIKKDLVPILIYVKDDPKIIDLTIKVLVNLTIPVECLLSVEDISRNNVGLHTIYELNNLLISSKEAFTDIRATKGVLDYMKLLLEKDGKILTSQLDNVNNCLLLLRNVLHIPESQNTIGKTPAHSSAQNQILWNLFTQSIDKILLYLITCSNGAHWSITMVQLIALIYKDQHVETLQKLLNVWFEASLSDSSEDNESNTSPPERGRNNSSPMVTSDPTSDSSDNGGSGKSNSNQARGQCPNQTEINIQILELQVETTTKTVASDTHVKHDTNNHNQFSKKTKSLKGKESEKQSTPNNNTKICSGPNSGAKRDSLSVNSEFSDCGYVTQLDNQESTSTSSNEDDAPQKKPVHQKPHTQKQKHKHHINKMRPPISAQEKKDIRRKKLVKRGKTNIINMKGLIHHTPTDEDITNVLKEFTVDFLLKGYGSLVKSLYTQLVVDQHVQIDTSHFFWLITYFFKFAGQLELDFEHVNQVLSFEIIAYLTNEGVNLCEEIQLTSKDKSFDIKPSLRRMHLLVTAIKEFIQTIDTYKKNTHLSEQDKEQLVTLQFRISSIDNLRCLLVLLLRHYQPDIHTKQYLQDLIVTNHSLLLFLDNAMKLPENPGLNLVEHLHQFATIEIMHQYGLLLEDFRTNGEYVNDCVFTMMHHVAGDLGSISTLFQPKILRTFSLIWETDFEICADWSDLVDYVINTFIKPPRPVIPEFLMETKDTKSTTVQKQTDIMESSDNESWTNEEIDILNGHYMQSSKADDIVDNICTLYKDKGFIKTHKSIIEHLQKLEIISVDDNEPPEPKKPKKEIIESENPNTSSSYNGKKDEVDLLKDVLETQHLTKSLLWLQKVLLEVCYTKICINNKGSECQFTANMEPVSFHNILINKSIPLVPWNNEQSTSVHNQTFLLLLHQLGFHLPEDTGKLFVRIPSFWTVDVLFHIACRLAPIDQSNLKFSIDVITGFIQQQDDEMIIDSTPQPFEGVRPKFLAHQTKEMNSIVKFTTMTSKIQDIQMDISPCKIEIIDDNFMGPPIYSSHSSMNDYSNLLIPISDDNSICETASVISSSDLNRMYVSDEEDKHDLVLL